MLHIFGFSLVYDIIFDFGNIVGCRKPIRISYKYDPHIPTRSGVLYDVLHYINI